MNTDIFSLLKNTPFFSIYDDQALKTLEKHLINVKFSKNEWIVRENEIVDSIYWILKGKAEVYRDKNLLKKFHVAPIAILHEKETIGLDGSILYSTTGLRTASVMAASPVEALRLNMEELKHFVDKYGHIQENLIIDKIHRLLLIKQSLPFQKISSKKLIWINHKIYLRHFKQGEIIFEQGDTAHECYLISSGEVRISYYKDKQDHELTILKNPAFFGEMSIIANNPRNARATALTDCSLLTLNKNDLLEILIQSKDTAKNFAKLFYDRSKPHRLEDILIYKNTDELSDESYVLKNPASGQYFKLSATGYLIFNKLDGNHTLQDITLELAERNHIFIPDEIAGLVAALRKAGFIKKVNSELPLHTTGFFIKQWYRLRQLFILRLAFNKTDPWVSQLYQSGMKFLFYKNIQIMMYGLALLGFFCLGLLTPSVLDNFFHKHVSLGWLLFLIPCTIVSTILHELAHALTVKHYGREVRYIGIGWFWFFPVAFTDTSDMWLAKRKERIAVNLAGIQQDMLTAGLAGLLAYVSTSNTMTAIFWLFAVFTLLRSIYMLNPMQDSDGYYLLMDYLDKPKLRLNSNIFLIKLLHFTKKEKNNLNTYRPEKIYWIANISYIVLTVILAYLIQLFLLYAFGIHTIHPWLKLIIPACVIIISCLSIVREFK